MNTESAPGSASRSHVNPHRTPHSSRTPFSLWRPYPPQSLRTSTPALRCSPPRATLYLIRNAHPVTGRLMTSKTAGECWPLAIRGIEGITGCLEDTPGEAQRKALPCLPPGTLKRLLCSLENRYYVALPNFLAGFQFLAINIRTEQSSVALGQEHEVIISRASIAGSKQASRFQNVTCNISVCLVQSYRTKKPQNLTDRFAKE